MRTIGFSVVAVLAVALDARPALADPNPCTVSGPPYVIACAANPPTVIAPVNVNLNGAKGDDGDIGISLFDPGSGGDDGANGASHTYILPVFSGNQAIELPGLPAAIFIESLGGNGGDGGDDIGNPFGGGHDGGNGGAGGSITLTVKPNLPVATLADQTPGIWVESAGGVGGNGGTSVFSLTGGGDGGAGGPGGNVSVTALNAITTVGRSAYGILAESLGGGGGQGGSSVGGLLGGGGGGGPSQSAGTVTVTLGGLSGGQPGTILTYGADADGILAQSIGGFGGKGGGGIVTVLNPITSGGDGQNGGAANRVTVTTSSDSSISTQGDRAAGILAQSLGGGGGAGGLGGSIFGAGGSGAPGGAGGVVVVTNGATITTSGAAAKGIFAQSVGGGGGDGGSGGGAVALGGQGSATSNGGNVMVRNTGNITTTSNQALSATSDAVEFGAQAIFAQSVGGGGGNGGSSGGIISIGGSGGGGGIGGVVSVTNSGATLVTNASQSDAIFAQSVGGGGGNGGSTVTVGPVFSAGVGGSAGVGSPGSDTSVTSSSGSITTNGDFSNGIQAQSVGGGGGNGGFAVATSVGVTTASLAVGGTGGGGGSGSTVEVTNGSPGGANSPGTAITTNGASSNGILAQSVGGGGGSGGFAIAAGAGLVSSTGISVGGSGGMGGGGATVRVKNNAMIQTLGATADGILAQSIGGGGGLGNFSVAGNVSIASGSGLSFGGSGGSGGNGGIVQLANGGTVTTLKDTSVAVEAQSVGGGGGNGGMSVSGSASLGSSIGLSLGGNGGSGGNGGNVTLVNIGALGTMGNTSDALLAQSIAGGGGNGAYSMAGGLSFGPGAGVSIGGGGGAGGIGGIVNAGNLGTIATMGTNSAGILAQSVGGGGGNGGFSVAGNVSGVGALDVSVGGSGGSGGTGGNVGVTNGVMGTNANITTFGAQSAGIEAQSIGGGGGNGGFSIAATASITGSLDLGIGGNGGAGSTAGSATVMNVGNITTGAGNATADSADAILAQSVAGGGGTGAFGIGGGVALGVPLSVALGGSGGIGGMAGSVSVTSTGVLLTHGDKSNGILAQSIGGGGGKGGFDIAGGLSGGASLDLGIGGSGGAGGSGGFVSVSNTGEIATTGNDSNAISAQSNGGGGGAASFSAAGGVSGGVSASLSLGGSGGSGGTSDGVQVSTSAGLGTCQGNGPPATVGRQCPPKVGTIMTSGDRSDGVNAQSSGGSGGTGGMSIAGSALSTVSLDASFGGSGGNGGQAGFVSVNAADDITTSGDSANGINAQSQGGGGGAGGFSIAGSVTTFLTPPVGTANLAIGGTGGNGGNGGSIGILNYGTIATSGAHANAIYAQSQGGTGGNGGFSVAGGIDVGFTPSLDMSVGGNGGNGSHGADVNVNNLGTLTTTNDDADGIYAISQGGGGGKAGLNVAGGITGSVALQLGIGGNGGNASTGGDVFVSNGNQLTAATITTSGAQSDGISAESIGGNGGNGSYSIAGGVALGATAQLSIGGNGGVSATSGLAQVADFGNITTGGTQSNGIHAQSVGGNGGNGGISIAGGVSPLVSGSLSVGGSGESGANAGDATVRLGGNGIFGGTIVTTGAQSNGIYAQSIGGGGGSGGFSVAGSITLEPSANLSIGGAAGDGGNGGTTTVSTFGNIGTKANASDGILAQSIGGGGGSGGFSVAGALSLNSSIPMSIGGQGGDAGRGGAVNVTSVGIIGTGGDQSSAIVAQSIGGGGGNGGFSVAGDITNSAARASTIGGVAGAGANGGAVTVLDQNALTPANAPTIFTLGQQADGILAQSVGGGGGKGGFSVGGSINNGSTFISSVGGLGGKGADGGAVSVGNSATMFTQGNRSDGIAAQSIGGGGGSGGFSVAGSFSSGIGMDQSIGGLGGAAGKGGTAFVDNAAEAIVTLGAQSTGVYAQSIGGGGGDGGFSIGGALNIGSSGAANSLGGIAGGGGDGGRAAILNGPLKGAPNFVGTAGDQADAILAQSVGGGGGDGGFAIAGTIDNANGVAQAFGGHGGGAGNGGSAEIIANTNVITTGDAASGIVAQSIGGGGGSGGWTVAGGLSLGGGPLDIAMGGSGGGGGNGGTTTLITANGTQIQTSGAQSDGLSAQSIGGGGGDGGFSIAGAITTGFTVGESFGGSGGTSGNGGIVALGNASAIVTTGDLSDGIFAQSIGGGGGNGGFAISGSGSLGLAANTSFGGAAAGGNDGGAVTVINRGSIATSGEGADGVLAQSAGGGGGNGGFSIAGTVTFGRGAEIGFGGNGAAGGNGGDVTLQNTAAQISTLGANANGLEAQSVGGGGGNGGFAIAGGIAAKGLLGVSLGGSAQSGGDGGTVMLSSSDASTLVKTNGDNANAIIAQSIGGGGGTGGFSIAGGINGGVNLEQSFGGSGGTGGNGGLSTVINRSLIRTNGTSANGIVAQSIGGGGGEGGFSIAGALSGSNAEAMSFGGNGGTGGRGGAVNVTNTAQYVFTNGDSSNGILAQAIGGGGGAGGFSIGGTGSLGSHAVGLSLGGNGGSGGVGGVLNVQSGSLYAPTLIATNGANADGILEQSIGGGGGSGGFSIEGLAAGGSTLGLAMGGNGGMGNNAGGIRDTGARLTNYSDISTAGASSNGILVQSIGGGGGSAGFNVTAKVNTDSNGVSVNGSMGFGSSGSGGDGESAQIVNRGEIATTGDNANAVMAQSIGGGGGYGGVTASTQVLGALGVNEGSTNGGGGEAGFVNIQNSNILITTGNNASDIVAQSIGGGGGNAAFAIAGNVSTASSVLSGVSLALGNNGGAGGDAGGVSVRSTGTGMKTSGVNSDGILAQAIGGGGGNGAFSINADVTTSYGTGLTLGGSGGNGGSGGEVTVQNGTFMLTGGAFSDGIAAQSIGGGGGNGGFAITGAVSLGVQHDVTFGGNGGSGNDGGSVTVTDAAPIGTTGIGSDAILAESIGGGGGNGGFSIAATVASGTSKTIGFGGSGGASGDGGTALITNSASVIATHGDDAAALAAASIGGGGGSGAFAIDGSFTGGLALSFGGSGVAGGNGGNVQINSGTSTGPATMIQTGGFNAAGIIAQSIGGGGGSAGLGIGGPTASTPLIGLGVGGTAGAYGNAGTSEVVNYSTIATGGAFSDDVLAQSIGGGGGSGNVDISDSTNAQTSGPIHLGDTLAIGGNAALTSVANGAQLMANGAGAFGIAAQSIGGGGGAAGYADAGNLTSSDGGGIAIGSIGGSCNRNIAANDGCGAGNGAITAIGNTGVIVAMGAGAGGILGQSIGGGGGTATLQVAGNYTGKGAFGAALGGLDEHGNGTTALGLAAATGSIGTGGFHSDGMQIQSIGGGGGSGTVVVNGDVAASALAYRAGGTGTSADLAESGNGGVAFVENLAPVITLGNASAALSAQSIGGGGGDAAIAIGGTVAPGTADLTSLYGGTNVAAGTSAGALIKNTGDLSTQGAGSNAILAQSIAGGGGSGGFNGTVTMNLGDGAFALVDAGGNADVESNAGPAFVTASGTIVTMGAGSAGVVAQSIGGGGGLSDRSLQLDLGSSGAASLAAATGGVNDYASSGGAVTVTTSAGEIDTVGTAATAILAQSIGGGGGTIGFSASGKVTSATTSSQVIVLAGASGGVRDESGAVTVTSGTKVETLGDGSAAIVAQSIGGGGGNSALAFIGTYSTGAPRNAEMYIGGTGNVSGDGAAVQVTSTGDIITGNVLESGTTGAFAHGILAQSIGGGGGTGNLTMGLGAPAVTATPGTFLDVLGGSGSVHDDGTSSQGQGGDATVTATGNVETMGGGANAIVAQSIGGGGGLSDVDVYGTAALSNGGPAAIVSIGTLVGGASGFANTGAEAIVTHTGGAIATFGDAADGIVAQSIGGGGGDGGSAHSIAGGQNDCSTSSASCSAQLTRLLVAVGGSGPGQSNDGGAVRVANDGMMQTSGEDSIAIVAQSIGGGGGIAGDDHSKDGSNLQRWAVLVGGFDNSHGNGGVVRVADAGGILTMGDGAHGILAQSIGGGGGEAGAGVTGTLGSLQLGGSDGSGGNGGAVGVLVANGTIHTQGAGAFGVLAQSVGGGGGVAGNLDSGIGKTTLGSGSTLTTATSGGGNGGLVLVKVNGNIETTGSGSDGIFAQSVGGGGGLAGATPAVTQSFAGSAGAFGNGGSVTVEQTGIIATTGMGADAIFAQSAGGTGVGGDINVTVNGQALAYGSNADGIVAQSVGGGGSGNVHVTVAAGSVVQGGSGAGSAGVRILGSGSNTLNNFGTITTAATPVAYPFDAVRRTEVPQVLPQARTSVATIQGTMRSGSAEQLDPLMTTRNFAEGVQIAVYAAGGSLHLNNYGNIYGSIALDGTKLDLVNDGGMVTGSVLDFGNTGTLTLASGSALTPGGGGFVAHTDMIGSLTQAAGSNYLITLNLANNTSSSMNVSGTAKLGGSVALDLLNTAVPAPGVHSTTIMTAAGGVTNDGATLALPNTAVATFALGFDPNDVKLNYTVDYAPTAGRVLSANAVQLGSYLARAATASSATAFTPLMQSVFGIPTLAQLNSFYNQLAPAATLALTSSALFSTVDFSNGLLSCREGSGLVAAGNCNWGSFGATGSAQSATFGSVGFTQQSSGFNGGYQRVLADGRTSIGMGIHFDNGGLSADGGSSFSGTGLMAGVSLKHVTPAGTTLSASVAGGASGYASTRSITYAPAAMTATGHQNVTYVGAHIRAEQTVLHDRTMSIAPFVDFGATRVAIGALNESGAGIYDATIAPQSQLLPTLQTGVALQTSGRYRTYDVRGGLNISVLQIVGSDQTSTTATLAGAPASVAPFALTNAIGHTHFEIGPSLAISQAGKLEFRVGGTYDFSGFNHSLGGYLSFGRRL